MKTFTVEPGTEPDTDYKRVFPRDLFNEAKLLKCLGRLGLLILDFRVPCKMVMNEPEGCIVIGRRNDNFLECTNIQILIKDQPFRFMIPYNSKSQYPLLVERDNIHYPVFDEDGEFDKEFIVFTKTIKNDQKD